MKGMSFSELWECSKAFRSIFVYRSIISNSGQVDRAEIDWVERRPRIEWHICGVDGCKQLAVAGEKCKDHSLTIDGKMVIWAWREGYLQKLCSDMDGKSDRKEYMKNERYVWRSKFGVLPRGYRIKHTDGNPLNESPRNLVMLTHVSSAAVDAGVLRVPEAIALDAAVPEGLLKGVHRKDVVTSWAYNIRQLSEGVGMTAKRLRALERDGELRLGDPSSLIKYFSGMRKGERIESIANAAGVSERHVRRAVASGELCIWSLKDVVDYCGMERKIGRPKKEWAYDVKSIAETAGVSTDVAYSAIRSGGLNPDSLSSVLDFCKGKQKKCRIKTG